MRNDELDEKAVLQSALAEAACYLEKASDLIAPSDPRFAARLLLARDRARATAGEDAVLSTRIQLQSSAEERREQQNRNRIAEARKAQGKD